MPIPDKVQEAIYYARKTKDVSKLRRMQSNGGKAKAAMDRLRAIMQKATQPAPPLQAPPQYLEQMQIPGLGKWGSITLDIEKGDVLLGGRFKNHKLVVEDIGTDDLGQPTVNGRKLLSFRIAKKMPTKTAALANDGYGDALNDFSAGEIVDYVLQHHKTDKRPLNPHYDLRLGTRGKGLHSWVVPGLRMPEPGQRVSVPQTRVHSHRHGTFEGRIPPGYGAGEVTIADKGKAEITHMKPESLHFSLGDSKNYALIRLGGKYGGTWQLVRRGDADVP
jgi:hypothetical protein